MTLPIVLFWLAQAGARALAWVTPRWRARDNQRMIRENGARDSLHFTFHRQQLTILLACLVPAGIVAYLPAWHHGFALGMLAYLAAALCLFGHVFNPRLNEARGKARWYVSQDPRAAWFDRQLVTMASRQLSREINAGFYKRRLKPEEVAARAAYLLEGITRWALIGTAALDGLALYLIAHQLHYTP